MVSKRIEFLAIFLVTFLLISSQVAAARELTEMSNNKVLSKESGNVDDCSISCCYGCCGISANEICHCCEKPTTDPSTNIHN